MTMDLREFIAMMYDNGCEFLRGEIEEKDLNLKKKFKEDILTENGGN